MYLMYIGKHTVCKSSLEKGGLEGLRACYAPYWEATRLSAPQLLSAKISTTQAQALTWLTCMQKVLRHKLLKAKARPEYLQKGYISNSPKRALDAFDTVPGTPSGFSDCPCRDGLTGKAHLRCMIKEQSDCLIVT